jgi:hypothetical protein
MKEYIERIKNDSLDIFQKDYARMIKEYKTEKAITNDYNGRQLLELIQNADDAKSDTVVIKLNKGKNILSISNKGESFIAEGYRSLMLSGLSSKIKKTYIGNKGLGFRSIINWSEGVKILSNNLSVEFSEKIKTKTFLKLYDENEQRKIRKEFSFSETVIPFPFLAIPEIKDYSNGNFTTTIEIQYKNEDWILEDIINQVKKLKPEVLLFLNNIASIHFEGFEDEIQDIIIDGKKEIGKPIKISGKEWIVFEDKGELDSEYQDEDSTEQEFYQVKIAIPQNFENETDVLFTFFPTKVNLEFPFVVHGTFDLDSSRNQLRKSDKNKFVLEKLIELIVETAKKISQKEISWKPIKLLRYHSQNRVLEDLRFYELINEKIKELALFPCVDGKYRKIDDTIQYSNDFSTFISKSNLTKIVENLLIPIDYDLKEWINEIGINFDILKTNYLIKTIDLLSTKLKTINERVELVYILSNNSEFYSDGQKYSILINEEKTIINKNTSVFTPPTTKSEKFDIPNFIKIDFLNRDFYRKLLNKFELQESREKARELQRELKEITNISSFEPANIINKIITESNRKIKKTKNRKATNEIIRKMIKSLFVNYKDLKETTRPDTSKVKLITKSGKAYNAHNLYLSSDYPSGKLTEDIFADVFPKNLFVASRKTLGLGKENEYHVESFLTNFLNVNIHTKFKKDIYPEYDYERFVFDFVTMPNNYSESSINITKIENTDIIFTKISFEKLLLWIIKDKYIFKQIDNRFNDDSFRYKKAREWYFHHSLDAKPSYIKYQIIKQSPFKFSELFVNNEKLLFINDFEINYKHPLFKKYDVSEEEINRLLLELGAKENFEDFSIERISKIITELKEKDPKGKNAQKIYKLAFEHYKKHKTELNLNEKTFLFSKKGDVLDYFPIGEVYYTANITLPQKIINQHPLLYFPKRQAEEDVSLFFGIQTFKNYKIEITDYKSNEKLTSELNDFLYNIKPYILTIRLNKISAGNQKQKNTETNAIKNLKISVCHSISCIINENSIELDEFDFIKSDNKFYIRLKTISSIQELRKNSKFSDIISEIITITLKVNENKTDFRTCYRNNIEDTEYHTITEYGEELLQEAKELLNMSDYQRNFWNMIFSIKGKSLNPKQNLSNQIVETFNLDFTSIINLIDYQFLSISNNIKYFENIFSELNISIVEYNSKSLKKIDLTKYHTEQLKNYFFSKEKQFKSLLWERLNSEPKNQETFLDLLSKYENSDYFINDVSTQNRYKFKFDINEAYNQFIKTEFDIEFQELTQKDELDLIYEKNKSEFSLKEQDIIEENTKTKSLLYFDKNTDKIKEIIEPFIEKEETINEEEDYDIEKTEVINDFTVKAKEINKTSKKKGVYTPNSSSNKRNKKKGNKSEKKVYAKLIELYGKDSVAWKSKEDEGLHYDIRYTKDGNNWIYAEVKSFDNGKFYLSKSEKLFGENNKDKYEIWLVNGNELYPIELFKIEDYNIEATEFIVSLEIEKNE